MYVGILKIRCTYIYLYCETGTSTSDKPFPQRNTQGLSQHSLHFLVAENNNEQRIKVFWAYA